MSSLKKGLQGVLGGQLSFRQATLEAFRRGRARVAAQRERSMLDELASQPVRLNPEFRKLSATELLKHFRERETPSFFAGFQAADYYASRQRELFPEETEQLLESARTITEDQRWPVLGFGEKEFGEVINWRRDPIAGREWPLDYHGDVVLWHRDGSDIRVLWELNRLGHFITLGRAYALTGDETLAREFFEQLESWQEQNPVGRGANWSCAMEVALRSMNLLAAFSLFRRSSQLNEERLLLLLTMFDQHGAHIRRNLEFSHLATSNHYLSDVCGLLWLGIMLPELDAARGWREWALPEMLRELDKQILPDGADYEASTGYHCFVLELFLNTLNLCELNEIQFVPMHRNKLHAMLLYLRDIMRPDGLVPLVGDTDSGQVLPIASRTANDRAYLLGLGAVLFRDSQFKLPGLGVSQELLWLFGEYGLLTHSQLPSSNEKTSSQAFPAAGTYVQRHEDLFLAFNANGAHRNRPASHRHNDALSVEVAACGTAFIVDPGSYVYTADLHERYLFRSTAYHSTVEVDGLEQNTTHEELPFWIGDEAQTKVIEWETELHSDRVVAEHYGYRRLPQPVTHKRSVMLNKSKRYWFVSDLFTGTGEHDLAFRFHFAPRLKVEVRADGMVEAFDERNGSRLLIQAHEFNVPFALEPSLENRFSSYDYGAKMPSVSACWSRRATLPLVVNFVIVPVGKDEDELERWNLAIGWED